MPQAWLRRGFLPGYYKKALMEEKTKFMIITGATAMLALVLFVLNLHTQGLKKSAERERDEIKASNTALTMQVEETKKKLDDAVKEKDRFGEDLNALNSKIAELTREKDALKSQYESLLKESEGLRQKSKADYSVKAPQEAASVSGDAYWSGVLKAKADLTLQLEKARSDLRLAQINSEQLKKEKEALDLDLKNMEREKQAVEEQVAYNQRIIDTMTAELVVEKNTKISSQDGLKVVKGENAALRRQLKALSNYKFRLEEKLQKLQEEKTTLERRFNEMSLLLENRMSQLGGMRQEIENIRGADTQEDLTEDKKGSVELPAIMVYPSQGPQNEDASMAPEAGRVISIDHQNNFVIIDIGKDSGIKEGRKFKVYRQGRYIADIEVMQAREKISACDIKKESAPVKTGDTVK